MAHVARLALGRAARRQAQQPEGDSIAAGARGEQLAAVRRQPTSRMIDAAFVKSRSA